jgi:hypothetical protein
MMTEMKKGTLAHGALVPASGPVVTSGLASPAVGVLMAISGVIREDQMSRLTVDDIVGVVGILPTPS